MSSRRAERIAALIQAEVSRLLREDVKDPAVGDISVTEVSVNASLSVAKIRYLPLGGRGDAAVIQAALDIAGRRMRGPVGRALGIRHAPELRFQRDLNVEYAAEMDALISRLPRPSEPPPEPPPHTPPESAPEKT